MTREEVKKAVCEAIEQNKEKLFAVGEKIFENPELGFKETKTSNLVKEKFDELGLGYEQGLAFTGIKARLKPPVKGEINVAVMGELDAVVCPLHPYANKETGAAHSCGHFAQITTMLGVATGLKLSGAAEYLGGNVTFLAVPAEECVELDFRTDLIKQGKLNFLGGKQQLITEGVFDDIDMAMIVHGAGNCNDGEVIAYSRSVGFIPKSVKFIGKEAHAGFAPWDGANALNAASLTLMAINSMRETFKDSDCIRVHPVITKGGTLVNIVPNDVRMEMYVRGSSIEAIKDANFKVNRAIKGAAYAVGVTAEITDLPGYLPLLPDENLARVFSSNANYVLPNSKIIFTQDVDGSSTDAGDVASIIPCIHGGMGGFSGNFHSKDFAVCDKDMAYIEPAKIMACTVVDLLFDNAEKAREIKSKYTRKLNHKEIWQDILKFEE
ncbi:MAG: amidohydrolase [Oscillospiraceae bacterium]